jgi:protein-S-isoprenylcysteine O-methyltransferase Ste14
VVRHPIYTGILTGFLGMAIAISQVRGFIAFVLIFLALWIKLRIEEQWMRSQFGETYATYARQTAALVPLPPLIACTPKRTAPGAKMFQTVRDRRSGKRNL